MNTQSDAVIHVVVWEGAKRPSLLREGLWFADDAPALVVGFVSPHLDFVAVTRELRAAIPATIPLVLTTTAGELCSADGIASPYCSTGTHWERIVLQSFSSRLFEAVQVVSLPLHNDDLRSGKPTQTSGQRVAAISESLRGIHLPFQVESSNTFVWALVDGLSLSENYFMEAVYQSQKLPCLVIGGSAGGLLDFQKTLIFNGRETLQNHAVLTVVKVAPAYRFGVFRSQNFEKVGPSFVVLGGNMPYRVVSEVVDPKKLGQRNFVEALCETFQCRPQELQTRLGDYAFGVDIGGQLYVRSVQQIQTEAKTIQFYCDVDIGDKLYLLKRTDFLKTTREDWARYLEGKSPPLGGILNDCILRRLNNSRSLDGLEIFRSIPVAGFSTFGELLGVNVNETLTAIFFHPQTSDQQFTDTFLDRFPIHYASFLAAFIERKLTRNAIVQGFFQEILTQLFDSTSLVRSLMESYGAIRGELGRYSSALQEVVETLERFSTDIGSNTEANNRIYKQVRALSEDLEEINKFSATVDDIAQQTGVLSINASIQAARVGEQGRGFAVVAGEVRKLSIQTQGHVKDITKTASSIVASVAKTLQGTEEARKLQDSLVMRNSQIHQKIDGLVLDLQSSVSTMLEGARAIESIHSYLKEIAEKERLVDLVRGS